MSLTPEGARRIRIWVITACIILGAALPFVIPGAVVVRQFTDIEAQIGFGAFVVWARGGARDVRRPTDRTSETTSGRGK